ncbi:Rha family transcriptional regulator [Campylobacter coli]|nr:Rha family transcriptional regulator [Campylobacter coli]EIQ8888456.1 Rha family transcriptional regulator [Campylobacter coli]EJK6965566.1 Rha family transcriptional regulator [Campylobacter coli]EJL7949431.1 Rha family transcriptional regulator [Campylobacter coli]EMC8705523.1 Rha family transcriptional regulator [Campylobacter coli]
MSALIPINNVNVVFEVVGDEIFANSLQIAEVFEKDHSNVLKAIDKLPNDEFKSSNFKYDSYFDKKSEQRRMINLTRDAFSLLVMGFTGEKAYKWKVEFIKAFNEMKKRLRNIEYEKHDKLAFRQSLGYKSQLAQQKEHYENKIKALKYDLEHKNELSFKRKLSQKELLELRKILARDYGILCIKEWEMSLVAEKIGKDTVFEAVLNKLEKELKYWQNYEEYEEKWKKILRR